MKKSCLSQSTPFSFPLGWLSRLLMATILSGMMTSFIPTFGQEKDAPRLSPEQRDACRAKAEQGANSEEKKKLFRACRRDAMNAANGQPSSPNVANPRFGDWVADVNGDYRESFTSNDSGSSIGVLCGGNTEACIAYLRSNTVCAEGAKQVALVNLQSGAFPIEMICAKIEIDSQSEFVSFLGDYGTMRGAMLRNNDIGIALPMQDGQFKVLRFSLRGASQAIEAVEKPPVSRSKYRDQMQ